MTSNRTQQRKAVGLLVKLAYQGVEDFASRYATNLSEGGMFIRTRQPTPAGTELNFRVEIAEGERVLQGSAVVRWTRGEGDPGGPPGMGLEFKTLDPASRALVDRMLAKGAAARPAPAAKAPAARPAATGAPSPPPVRPPPAPAVAARSAPSAAPSLPPSAARPPAAPAAAARPAASTASAAARPSAPAARTAAAPAASAKAAASAAPAAPARPPASAALSPRFTASESALNDLADLADSAESDAHLSPPPVASPPPAGSPADALDEFELFGALAEADPENEIDVDLSALVAETPKPPPPVPDEIPDEMPEEIPFDLSDDEPEEPADDSAFAIDVDLDEPAARPPAARAPAARPAPEPAPTGPVTLEAPRPVEVAPLPASGEPVYLKGIVPSLATGQVLGIDLGTTNTACAVLSKGRPVIVRSKDGYSTIPSVVALTKQGRLAVGHRARSQMVLNPAQSIVGAKRLVGREFDSATVKQVKDRAHFDIVAGADRRAAVRLGNNTVSLEEVQALVLKECRDVAEQSLGVVVDRAVITCPAYYSEPQREAVRRAGAMAGLKVERVLNEPTAAALAFGMNRGLKKTVLVYDLGGGTFDATLMRLEENVFEVLATGGDVFLGGVDFDNQLVDVLLARFAEMHKKPFAGDRVALSRVAEVAELAKVSLSERMSFDVHLPMLDMDAAGQPMDLKTTLTRADLEAACTELVERTIQVVQDVLLDARLKVSEVEDVVLVGGMSRMPLVREKLKALFKKPPQASVNADEAVALGAALYSGTVDKVSSLVLIDVVPMTLGLGMSGGSFHRLIERNTPLPATKSFGISTQKDNETELELMVFQGEDSNVAGNEFLGALTITGLPRGPKGSVHVAVTLSLDAECVLRVEAREFSTRTVVRSTLATRYTTEEIAARLGITKEKRHAATKARGEELTKRSGGFWDRVKGLFGKS